MTRTHKSTRLLSVVFLKWKQYLEAVSLGFDHFFVLFTDIADDYILISATLNCLSADDSTANKKWAQLISIFFSLLSKKLKKVFA